MASSRRGGRERWSGRGARTVGERGDGRDDGAPLLRPLRSGQHRRPSPQHAECAALEGVGEHDEVVRARRRGEVAQHRRPDVHQPRRPEQRPVPRADGHQRQRREDPQPTDGGDEADLRVPHAEQLLGRAEVGEVEEDPAVPGVVQREDREHRRRLGPAPPLGLPEPPTLGDGHDVGVAVVRAGAAAAGRGRGVGDAVAFDP